MRTTQQLSITLPNDMADVVKGGRENRSMTLTNSINAPSSVR